jgi:copper chaperone CopZ
MTTTAALSTCELVVPGLCCVECSLGVVTALKRAAGVQGVRVLGTAEKTLVTYDTGMTDPAALVHVVEQAGHAVQAWRPLPAGRSGVTPHRVLEVPALAGGEQRRSAAGPSAPTGQQAK